MNAFIRTPHRGLSLLGEFDDIVNGLLSPARVSSATEQTLTPAIDIRETAAAYYVLANLPGIKKDSLSVSVQDKILSFEAQSVDVDLQEENEKTVKIERLSGKYMRTLKLGNAVDESKISAEYADGVLKLKLPKVEKVESRKIDVAVH
jgi:HSP20 family protein